MQPVISMPMWVSLPNEVRYRIRAIFSIPCSSNTVVNDGRIESDGTTFDDFKHLTIQKMREYLNDDSTDFHKLFDLVVSRVNDELKGVKEPITLVASGTPITVVIEPKKRGRPKKV